MNAQELDKLETQLRDKGWREYYNAREGIIQYWCKSFAGSVCHHNKDKPGVQVVVNVWERRVEVLGQSAEHSLESDRYAIEAYIAAGLNDSISVKFLIYGESFKTISGLNRRVKLLLAAWEAVAKTRQKAP